VEVTGLSVEVTLGLLAKRILVLNKASCKTKPKLDM
jgi:hypothetical protein